MSQAPVHVYAPGEVLTAQNLNNSVQQALTNPIGVISPTTGPINFNLQPHTNFPLASVSGSSGTVGLVATLGAALVPVWAASPAAPQASRMGVTGLVGSATSSQAVTLAFRQATMLTTDRMTAYNMTASSSFGMTVATSGPGGRDQAANFASTFVHAYVISTGLNSTTPVGLLSTSYPQPVMQTSYTAYAYLTTLLYSSASTGFATNHIIRGKKIYYSTMQNAVTLSHSTSETSVSLVGSVPANAETALLKHAFVNLGAASGTASLRFISSQDFYVVESSTNATINTAPLEVPNVSQSIITLVSNAAAAGVTIDVLGFTVTNGG